MGGNFQDKTFELYGINPDTFYRMKDVGVNFKNMIKFFKKEKNFKKERESLWLNMNFYWQLTVFFMFVVILLSFFFGYYLFAKINKEPALSMDNDISRVEIVKKGRIEKVLEYFSLRKQKSNQILISPAPVADPSL